MRGRAGRGRSLPASGARVEGRCGRHRSMTRRGRATPPRAGPRGRVADATARTGRALPDRDGGVPAPGLAGETWPRRVAGARAARRAARPRGRSLANPGARVPCPAARGRRAAGAARPAPAGRRDGGPVGGGPSQGMGADGTDIRTSAGPLRRARVGSGPCGPDASPPERETAAPRGGRRVSRDGSAGAAYPAIRSHRRRVGSSINRRSSTRPGWRVRPSITRRSSTRRPRRPCGRPRGWRSAGPAPWRWARSARRRTTRCRRA